MFTFGWKFVFETFVCFLYGSHPAHQVFCWLDLHIRTIAHSFNEAITLNVWGLHTCVVSVSSQCKRNMTLAGQTYLLKTSEFIRMNCPKWLAEKWMSFPPAHNVNSGWKIKTLETKDLTMPLSQSKTWGEMGVPVGMAENTWVTWGEITHL